MSLEDWLSNFWLHRHETSADEIQALIYSAEEDLRSARIEGVASGWKLNMAYTAALRYARAALAACNYRPGREREHERTIDSLVLTIPSTDPNIIKLLHSIRKKRHAATYDSIEMISDAEADAAMSTAIKLGELVIAWLKQNHPEYLN